jgi:MFS family permease
MDDPYGRREDPRRLRSGPAAIGRPIVPDEPSPSPGGRRIGPVEITPTRVILGIAIVASILFAIYTLTVRDATQIPLLAAGAAVLGIVFTAVTVAGVVSTYRAGSDERTMRATILAIGSGISSIIALGAFAGAVLLALFWTGGR